MELIEQRIKELPSLPPELAGRIIFQQTKGFILVEIDTGKNLRWSKFQNTGQDYEFLLRKISLEQAADPERSEISNFVDYKIFDVLCEMHIRNNSSLRL